VHFRCSAGGTTLAFDPRGSRRLGSPSSRKGGSHESSGISRARRRRRSADGAFLGGLVGAGFLAPLAARAQQPDRFFRIGMIERTSIAVNAVNVQSFRHGLRDLATSKASTSSSSTDRPRARISAARGW